MEEEIKKFGVKRGRGRPKGSLNKKTVMNRQLQAAAEAFEMESEDEVVEINPVLGAHKASGHLLNLHKAPGESVNAQHEEIKAFFEDSPYERPGRIRRFFALLWSIGKSERDYRLLSPGKPRLIEKVADELLICNLFEIIFIAARACFTAYFSILILLANLARRDPAEKAVAPKNSFQKKKLEVVLRPVVALKAPKPRAPRVPLPKPVSWGRNFGYLRFAPPLRFERALAAFMVLSFVFILPLRLFSTYGEVSRTKSILLERSVKAFEALNNSWSQVGNLEAAALAFEDASDGFDAVLKDIEKTHELLQKVAALLPEGEELDAGKSLLLAGSLVAASAEVLAGRLADLNESVLPPAERVHQLGESLATALPLLKDAREKLDSISIEVIPFEFRSGAAGAVKLLDQVINGVESSEAATSVLEHILGRTEPKRYLVVFQNNTELRPTGGFIGSFAEIDFVKGEVARLWMPGGGSYELQGLLRATVIPPEPLQLISERWEFQDANWFPDFPTSAKKLAWFYEKSGGPTVDGVIALTTSVVEKLLLVTGPIEMPEYGKVITSDNFWIETQKAVELEYDKEENKPKQFLADLAPKLIAKLKSSDPKTFFALAKSLNETIEEKHFQIYLFDSAEQEKITHLGWGGEMKASSGDTLSVINTNVAGGKTDGVISEHIKHQAKISENGRVLVTLEVTRTHNGVKGEIFRGVRNVDYVRVYVPEGSTLLESSGWVKPDENLFKPIDPSGVPDNDLAPVESASVAEPGTGTRISHEFGRTVFGNWIMVDPGSSVTYRLVYELPFRITWNIAEEGLFEKLGLRQVPAPQAAYSLLMSKQAGTKNTTIENSVEMPATWQVIWKTPGEAGKIVPVNRDRFFGIVASKTE